MVTKINDRLFSWASEVDGATIEQAKMTARLPIVAGHVALMPDAHLGVGSTVGSVIPTKGAVIPSAIGVDIGCGMSAIGLDMTASQLPDDLSGLLSEIERRIPAGVGKGITDPDSVDDNRGWIERTGYDEWLPEELVELAAKQLGTLGSGNHFVEVCLDEHERVWLVLHSGSRGVGNKLAQHHIGRSKELARELDVELEHQDLAYLTEGTEDFDAYIQAMRWAQDYAKKNREIMRGNLYGAFLELGIIRDDSVRVVIDCHHNFTELEWHGEEHGPVWVTRKGAVSARFGELGIIPGSMGTKSYIVVGLGNRLSWGSCSHGAGRRMSRNQARKQFTADDLAVAMGDRVWLADRADKLTDEAPGAYKDIDRVMADQTDLVRPLATLTQILNYKGT